jgi:hypothetical protein
VSIRNSSYLETRKVEIMPAIKAYLNRNVRKRVNQALCHFLVELLRGFGSHVSISESLINRLSRFLQIFFEPRVT